MTFALISPLPAKSSPPLSMPSSPPPHSCSSSHDVENIKNYAATHNYPNNLLRNVARRGTPSEFILVIDIDMLPNENLRQVCIFLVYMNWQHFLLKLKKLIC